ncbi:MAG: hypothetical protein HW387_907 [Parachlamydiales bacterium]|nr:hypothetical protein [Parachlamydiales bacterium]
MTEKVKPRSLLTAQEKTRLFEKAMTGDATALVECGYTLGINSREELDDFYEIQRQCEQHKAQDRGQ